jgi:hypothetical protein
VWLEKLELRDAVDDYWGSAVRGNGGSNSGGGVELVDE